MGADRTRGSPPPPSSSCGTSITNALLRLAVQRLISSSSPYHVSFLSKVRLPEQGTALGPIQGDAKCVPSAPPAVSPLRQLHPLRGPSATQTSSDGGAAGLQQPLPPSTSPAGGEWRFDMIGLTARSSQRSASEHIRPRRRIGDPAHLRPFFGSPCTLEPTGDGTALHWDQTFADARIAEAVATSLKPADRKNLDRLRGGGGYLTK